MMGKRSVRLLMCLSVCGAVVSVNCLRILGPEITDLHLLLPAESACPTRDSHSVSLFLSLAASFCLPRPRFLAPDPLHDEQHHEETESDTSSHTRRGRKQKRVVPGDKFFFLCEKSSTHTLYSRSLHADVQANEDCRHRRQRQDERTVATLPYKRARGATGRAERLMLLLV